jgi:hypothetical protein
MDKIIIIEALIATPPTSKCKETIRILEETIRRHPDELRLVVFKRGVDFVPEELRQEASRSEEAYPSQQASLQMRVLIQKGSAVPSVVVNGVLFSSFVVPDPEELEAKVQEILRGSAGA